MAHHSRLFAALTGACIAAATLLAPTAASADATAPAAPAASPANASRPEGIARRVAAENTTLLPALRALGGKLSTDGRFMVMPNAMQVSVAPMSLSDCPSGWVCLYQDLNFAGRMAKWNSPGSAVDLTSAGFNDQMTSWANKSPYDARWFYNAGYSGTSRCMQPGSNNSYVGDSDSDKASSLRIYTDGLAC